MASEDPESRTLTLACGEARAVLSRRGAECSAWRAGGFDLIWTPDAAVWPAASPILFPIVGRLRDGRMKIGERSYPMGTHGFAAASLFTATQTSADAAHFSLADDAVTLAAFPFAFQLAVSYRLTERALSVELAVLNAGAVPMPYACGLHPGFRWPFDGGAPGDYRVEFERAEAPRVPLITQDGLFDRATRSVPLEDRMLPLSHQLLAREALCFLDVASGSFRFVAPSGRAVRLATEDFPHFALWSRPPASFLCLESWTGHGDPADFDADVFAKPSMRILAPGASARHAARYSLE